MRVFEGHVAGKVIGGETVYYVAAVIPSSVSVFHFGSERSADADTFGNVS